MDMIEADFLTKLTNEIMTHGYDAATASDYAVILGDTPLRDEAGNIVVMERGRVLATLPPLKCYAEPGE